MNVVTDKLLVAATYENFYDADTKYYKCGKLEKIPKLDDTTDAMALAICHAHSARFSEPIK